MSRRSHQAVQPRGTGALHFPDSFQWGTATSAYQIEGAVKEDGRGQSIWDTFSQTPGRVMGGDTGETAADHYHRYAEDLDLMRSLGVTTYRFSISWPRIQADGRGRPNRRGLDFYRRLVDGLHERGISPLVTLYHWDLPQALQDRGGWENRDCAQWFGDYAAIMFEALGDAVPTWTTINEPKTVAHVGYTMGGHAPGKQDPDAAMVVTHHLLLAHGIAVRAFRAAGVGQRIGPVLNLAPVYPADDTPAAARATVLTDAAENGLFLDPIFRGTYPPVLMATIPESAPVRQAIKEGDLEIISAPVDILAVNYYHPVYVLSEGAYALRHPTSVAPWQQVYPQGLYDILVTVNRDYGPIPITIGENGVPTDDRVTGGNVHDPKRIEFLRDHLVALHRAISAGVPVESYHLWSLLDNFEWAEGYHQRWGIVHVDFATQERLLKDSAKWYRDVIARNAVQEGTERSF